VARFEWIRGWPAEEESKPEWLTSLDSQTCYTIAGAGGLEVLKHVREQGCEWNKWTCSDAAAGGHLEVLKWARANDCEWDPDECKRVTSCKAVTEWIEASIFEAFYF